MRKLMKILSRAGALASAALLASCLNGPMVDGVVRWHPKEWREMPAFGKIDTLYGDVILLIQLHTTVVEDTIKGAMLIRDWEGNMRILERDSTGWRLKATTKGYGDYYYKRVDRGMNSLDYFIKPLLRVDVLNVRGKP